jgi:hypothetical protein
MSFPSFVIPGFQKSGTTSLVDNLRQHPKIFFPKGHEVHFFDKHWHEGIEWYQFKYENSGDSICGDKTPMYITAEKFIKSMYKILPNIKIIILMRNPIDRIFSAYQHRKRNSKHMPNFEEWIFSENSPPIAKEAIIRGFYHNQIQVLLKYYDLKQIKFFIQEQMWANTTKIIESIFEFIGVTPIALSNFHRKKRNYEPMNKKTRQKLSEIYQRPNKELFDFLGYEIEEWK